MKERAKRVFLNRLERLRESGVDRVTLTPVQARFLEGLTEERQGQTFYKNMMLVVADDEPEPTQVSKQSR